MLGEQDRKTTSSSWTFFTNHAHVLLCLAGNPAMRIRDLADEIGITERAVQRILSELTDSGYIERFRDGRTNTYTINTTKHLKHPIESARTISDLIKLITDSPADTAPPNTSVASPLRGNDGKK